MSERVKMKLADVRVPGSDYTLDMSKVFGKKISRVEGYVTNDFGDPLFALTNIVFEDGTTVDIGGEHDCPYVECYDDKVNENLTDLYEEENPPEDDEDEE